MMKEGFSLFLVNTLYVADKIMEGGGGGDSAISFRFFFPDSDFFYIIIQIGLSLRVAGLHLAPNLILKIKYTPLLIGQYHMYFYDS